jgi:hypothetical protein
LLQDPLQGVGLLKGVISHLNGWPVKGFESVMKRSLHLRHLFWDCKRGDVHVTLTKEVVIRKVRVLTFKFQNIYIVGEYRPMVCALHISLMRGRSQLPRVSKAL